MTKPTDIELAVARNMEPAAFFEMSEDLLKVCVAPNQAENFEAYKGSVKQWKNSVIANVQKVLSAHTAALEAAGMVIVPIEPVAEVLENVTKVGVEIMLTMLREREPTEDEINKAYEKAGPDSPAGIARKMVERFKIYEAKQ